jgi:hypothetical protein
MSQPTVPSEGSNLGLKKIKEVARSVVSIKVSGKKLIQQ